MNVYAFTALINAVASFIAGFFVYFRARKTPINRSFMFFSLSVAIWSLNYFFWQIAKDENSALFWSKALMAGAIFIPVSYFHFIVNLLNIVKEKKKSLIIGYVLCFIFLFLDFTPFFIKGVAPRLSFAYWPEPGLAFHPFLLMFFLYAIYSWYLMFKSYRKTIGMKREQIKYVLIGTFIGFLGGSTNYLLWYNIPVSPFGNGLVALYVLLVAYAIARYRLMDIKLFLGRGMIYFISLAIVIGLAFLSIFLNNSLSTPVPINIMISLAIGIGIILFQPIFRFFEKLASKYFYYAFYSYQKVLTDLGRKLTKFLDLDKLSSLIANTLIETMKLNRTVILLREPDSGNYIIQRNIGFREENGISLVRDNFLTIWLEKTQKPLVSEEISLVIRDLEKGEIKIGLENLKENMKRIEAGLCLPLLLENKIIGMIVLGNKLSGEPYSQQDIELLTTLSNQASIALQNAQSYSKIKNFNVRLEKEVNKATKELKEAYEELQKLDKAKSEFVSIASHQLRTPLTAIKGYISMMLEKDYGNPPKAMESPLKNIYTSNERLIKLVNDLLNVSRIEAGRIEIKKESFSLETMINSIIEELKGLSDKKNIYLKFEKSKKSIPNVSADKDKMRQAIINIIDNAIHYTVKGGITIQIQKQGNKLKIIITDTGEGMTKNELSYLFESFSRGKAGNKLWTEGAGLGLYVSRRFIELNRGKVWAESAGKNKGSTFYIELPIK
ncbi:MAG: GAF domain-containing protein [Candidatus Pacebacteria bacterium]|nr:GAF domain-containing protein [Candidatus Paceibacterota bacterium]